VLEGQEFLEDHTGIALQHVSKYSFDPAVARGKRENFIGVAQVPIVLQVLSI